METVILYWDIHTYIYIYMYLQEVHVVWKLESGSRYPPRLGPSPLRVALTYDWVAVQEFKQSYKNIHM